MAEGLRPLEGRARWAIVALAATIVTELLSIGVNWSEIDLVNRELGGENVPISDFEASDNRQAIVAILYIAVLIATTVLFIRWFRAAYGNLLALGQPHLRFKPGWSIGAWFVPFLNLWRPKQIANDIWNGSGPNAPPYGKSAWKDASAPTFLGVWWLFWIVGGLLDNVVARTAFSRDTLADIRDADRLEMAASVVSIVGASLAILVVRRLTARQQERAQRIAVTGLPVATAGTVATPSPEGRPHV